MPKFTDFIDSFYAPQMWGEGYEFWPYIITVAIVLVAVVIFVSMKKPVPNVGMRMVPVTIFLSFSFLFTGVFANQANWSIAKENIMEKYDVPSMTLVGYELDEKGITDNAKNLIVKMVPSSEESSAPDKLFFVFKEGDNEPFLLRQDMSDEEFEKVEKMVLKNT